MKGIELKTERLILRTVRPADAGGIFAYRSLPEVCKYQGRHENVRKTRRIITLTNAVKPNTPMTWHQLAVLEKKSGRLVGDIGIHFKDKENQQAELAYTLAPQYQGRGYATEAALRVLAYLFGKLKKHRVAATADPRNKGSVNVMKRIGMRKEGYFKKSFWTGKEWTDDVAYAVLREEREQGGKGQPKQPAAAAG